MKKILIILMLLPIGLFAQDLRRGAAIVGYHVATVAMGAFGDAVYDNGHKHLGHLMEATELGMAMAGGFIFKIEGREWWNYGASYIFIRISMFDPYYNLGRGLPVFEHVGTTSYWDGFWSEVQPNPAGKGFFHGVSFIVGASIPLNYLGRQR